MFSRNRKHGNTNVFKNSKSVKEAVIGRSTWLMCCSQQERKEKVEMNRGILHGGEAAT